MRLQSHLVLIITESTLPKFSISNGMHPRAHSFSVTQGLRRFRRSIATCEGQLIESHIYQCQPGAPGHIRPSSEVTSCVAKMHRVDGGAQPPCGATSELTDTYQVDGNAQAPNRAADGVMKTRRVDNSVQPP